MYGALGMTGMRTGLAPRAGRVSTEAKGRFGCTHRMSSASPCFMILVKLLHHCCGLTGGLGLFFLFVVDLEPENKLLRAANAALALATFLLGPVPRNTCLSTSTCHNTQLNIAKAAFSSPCVLKHVDLEPQTVDLKMFHFHWLHHLWLLLRYFSLIFHFCHK